MPQPPFQYQTYQPSRQSVVTKSPQKQPRNQMVFIAVAGVILGVYGLFSVITNIAQGIAGSVDSAKAKSVVSSPIPSSLQKSLGALIAANPQTQIGIALENIASGQSQTYGVTTPFVAASTAKLITAAAYYHLVETGRASLSAPMGSYTAGFQIKEMINQSSNDSWDLLVAAITQDGLVSYARSIGINYGFANNTLAPADMAKLLSKLYSGTLLNQTSTKQLLSYMQNTNDDTLIPAAVTQNVTVYHKYGLLSGELHDAAILTNGTDSYALVIYTKGTSDSDDAQRTQVIHQLTHVVTSAVFGA